MASVRRIDTSLIDTLCLCVERGCGALSPEEDLSGLRDVCDNYHSIANIPVWERLLEYMIAVQLQVFWEETNNLDPFQSGFRPRLCTKIASE